MVSSYPSRSTVKSTSAMLWLVPSGIFRVYRYIGIPARLGSHYARQIIGRMDTCEEIMSKKKVNLPLTAPGSSSSALHGSGETVGAAGAGQGPRSGSVARHPASSLAPALMRDGVLSAKEIIN